jgi:hypothetical protein
LAGHGGRFVRALLQHRRARETAILSRIEAGDSTILAIVANVYEGLDPALTNAAAASVRAHIEDLGERALVRTERSVPLGALYATGIKREARTHLRDWFMARQMDPERDPPLHGPRARQKMERQ